MKTSILLLSITCLSVEVFARGPSCDEWGGCEGSDFIGYLFWGSVLIAFIYGTYTAHGISGFIPFILWVGSISLGFYLVINYDAPVVLPLIAFTGLWWFDSVMKKLGLRDKDYEP